MHTDRKKNIQTSTKIGRERNGERGERRGRKVEGRREREREG